MTQLTQPREIRVVAPSSSWSDKRTAGYNRGLRKLEQLGYKVTFGRYITDDDGLGSALASKRAEDLMAAYRDPNVAVVMALGGGWLANSVLPYIDWQVLQDNPKPLVGYSDITVVLNAIYAKTGGRGYLGPNLGTLGFAREGEYTLNSLRDALARKKDIELLPSLRWGEGNKRKIYSSEGWVALQRGQARGTLIGGNIASLYLLQGTEYMPPLNKPTILAIEDDDEAGKYSAREFDRRLESLLQQPGARANITGIMVGRLQVGSGMAIQDLAGIFARKKLRNIPIVANMDFGHTLPMATLPIGGVASMDVGAKIQIKLSEY